MTWVLQSETLALGLPPQVLAYGGEDILRVLELRFASGLVWGAEGSGPGGEGGLHALYVASNIATGLEQHKVLLPCSSQRKEGH